MSDNRRGSSVTWWLDTGKEVELENKPLKTYWESLRHSIALPSLNSKASVPREGKGK